LLHASSPDLPNTEDLVAFVVIALAFAPGLGFGAANRSVQGVKTGDASLPSVFAALIFSAGMTRNSGSKLAMSFFDRRSHFPHGDGDWLVARNSLLLVSRCHFSVWSGHDVGLMECLRLRSLLGRMGAKCTAAVSSAAVLVVEAQ
jgi:hypothetical protein